MAEVLRAEDVSKKFLVRRNRPQTIREAIAQRLTGRWDSGSDIWALRDVSFTLKSGRVLGIIGHNGAGKSTLLRLLCGLGRPTSGSIRVTGSIGSLLELGSGFQQDMTGRENLLTGGILSGLTKREVGEIEDDIISFAELEQFIDQPVRTYSTGMYTRLAFATAINFNPDVLVIDEILAVGDSRFQKKCKERLERFRADGKSLVIVSHDLDQILSLCDEVLVLEEGRAVMKDSPEFAVDFYHDLMRKRTEKRSEQLSGPSHLGQPVAQGSRIGTGEVLIDDVCVYDDREKLVEGLRSGGGIRVDLAYSLNSAVTDFAVVLSIHNELHIKCFETQVESARGIMGPLPRNGNFSCYLPQLPLMPGRYFINVGLYPTDWDYTFDYHWQMHPLDITNSDGALSGVSGIVSIRPVWSVLQTEDLR